MAHVPSGGEMWWKREGNDRVLHLRHNASEPWRPYQDFPDYALPDPQGFTQGIATFLALLKKDWVTIKP